MNNNLQFMIKRISSIVLALLLLVPIVGPKRVMAEGINFIKSGDANTFTENVPIDQATLFIDVSKINKNYTWESTIENVKQIEFNGSNILVVEKTLEAEEEYTPSGTLTLTFKDAFIDTNDSRSDLVLEISDVYIKQLNDNPDVYYYGIIENGKSLTTEAYDKDGKAFKWDDNPMYVKKAQRTNRSVNFKVYKKDSSGDKFVFGIKDLDVGEYPASGDQSYIGKEYIESIQAIDGYGDVYIPESTILNINETNYKMSATETDNDTWNSGYITLFSSNNESEWRGSGTNTKTTLFETLPFHKVEDIVKGGGEIKYVKDDEEKDQGLIVTGGGTSVSIVTRPLEGHKIKKITIDDVDATPEDKLSEFSYTFDNIDEDHVIIAEYEPFSYKINYDANGGQGEMTSDTFIYTDETMKSKDNAFTREGYHFKGFKALDKDGNPLKDKDGNELPLFKSADDFKEYLVKMGDGAEITLQAQWEPDEYTIKYDPNGGEGTMTDQHFSYTDKEAKSKPNAFTAGGFDFMGFKAKDKDGNYLKDKDGNDLVFVNPADFISYLKKQGNGGEITLVAQWKKKEYKLPIPKTGVE